MTGNREELIAGIAREVIARLQGAPAAAAPAAGVAVGDGVFATVDEAVSAAAEAQPRVAEMTLEARGRIIAIVRRLCADNAREWAQSELDESGLGRLDHKIEKLKNVQHVLGVEAMHSELRSDRSGLCIIEHAPWGVIGMILPATHSVPTMASNMINVVAAGNTAVFSPHPAASKIACHALKVFNREIARELGVANVFTTVSAPSIRSAEEVFHHPRIALLCVTGGPAVVRAAAKSGKRVIAAGPGNPPVVVDETADFDNAAKSIIYGGAYDNNLLCIAEKEVFVVASVFDEMIEAMTKHKAIRLNADQIAKLTKAAFVSGEGGKLFVNKDLIGQDAGVLAKHAGVSVPADTELLFGETDETHPFVDHEQMMPFVPFVRCPDVDVAIALAKKYEHGFKHTALIHSRNVDTITRMGRALDVTIFVQNGPCTAGLGEAYLSFSIATPTGEGVTTPLTFSRVRRSTTMGSMRVV